MAELLKWRVPLAFVMLNVLMSFSPILDQKEEFEGQ